MCIQGSTCLCTLVCPTKENIDRGNKKDTSTYNENDTDACVEVYNTVERDARVVDHLVWARMGACMYDGVSDSKYVIRLLYVLF